MRCLSSSELKRHASGSRRAIVVGVFAILCAVALGVWSNWSTAVPVSVRVDGLLEAVSQDGQKGSTVNQLRFYPTASVEYQGRAERVTLKDFYVDRAMANAEVGRMREIHVDRDTLQPVEAKPFQALFLIPLFFGMIDLAIGIVWLYRYSDYRRLDRAMRRPRQGAVRRGTA